MSDALNHKMKRFQERWTPSDPRDAAEFQTDLHSLMRSVFMDLQAPILEALSGQLRKPSAVTALNRGY
jgi:hypothetical protein